MTLDEEAIIINCQTGNLDDFAKLYDKYIKKIYDFTYYRILHKETTEDLVSKTFFKALSNIDKYQADKGSFSSWLYKIAKNTIIDYCRTKKETTDIDNVWDLSSNEDILRDADNKQKLEQVEQYLKKLKKEQREIIMMRVWDGLSYKEIAAITKKSEANCKVIFSRTINTLRQQMPLEMFILLLTLKL